MRAYVLTTGSIFGLLVLVHLWRLIQEWAQIVRDPWYALATIVAAVLFGWSIRLVRDMRRNSTTSS
jgi:hypothetical protein